MKMIDGNLYEIFAGDKKYVLRVCSMCDDPEYEFGYDLFDAVSKKLIDGGVFNLDDATSENELAREAIRWCDLNPDEVEYSLIGTDIEYSDLEEQGYTGF